MIPSDKPIEAEVIHSFLTVVSVVSSTGLKSTANTSMTKVEPDGVAESNFAQSYFVRFSPE